MTPAPTHTTLPTPNSWYAVAFSDELKAGGVLARTVAERDLVVFRTASGVACAFDAYCPHLGAHLGIGGKVVGETLRCPFHAFRYDTAGVCVATGYGTKPPPTARASVWPIREVDGIVFVYYDCLGRPPTWEPPALETAGWTPLIHRVFDLHDHAQETVENSVDLGHFAIVHGYSEMTERGEPVIEGARFQTAYSAGRPAPVLGRFGATVRFDFAIDLHGLGCSIVTIGVPSYGVTARLFVLATPTVKERINLALAVSLREIEDPARMHPLARLLPHQMLQGLIARMIHQSVVHDARQDFVIWEHKRYTQPPALAQGDGPIGKFRLWARQFYAQPDVVAPVSDEPGHKRAPATLSDAMATPAD
jgi:nitrite reductase/ring-hydroxylating ferredoxin subunit